MTTLVFLKVHGIQSIESQDGIQFYADSSTYHEIANGEHSVDLDETGLVSVAGNFFGPIAILNILNNNYYFVATLNILIFYFSITQISKLYKISPLKLLTVLLLNPITISSLLSINKEIISLLFLFSLLKYINCKKLSLLPMVFITALMVRWQLVIFAIIIIFYYSNINVLFKKPWQYGLALLLTCSVAYTLTGNTLAAVRLNFELSAENHDGSGIWISLIELQNQGYYFLVFPLKAAQLLFGLSFNVSTISSSNNFYNDVIQVLGSLSTLTLFIFLLINKTLKKNSLTFISILYLIFFCLSPIYTPRYLYPIYIIWSILACASHKKNHKEHFRKHERRNNIAADTVR